MKRIILLFLVIFSCMLGHAQELKLVKRVVTFDTISTTYKLKLDEHNVPFVEKKTVRKQIVETYVDKRSRGHRGSNARVHKAHATVSQTNKLNKDSTSNTNSGPHFVVNGGEHNTYNNCVFGNTGTVNYIQKPAPDTANNLRASSTDDSSSIEIPDSSVSTSEIKFVYKKSFRHAERKVNRSGLNELNTDSVLNKIKPVIVEPYTRLPYLPYGSFPNLSEGVAIVKYFTQHPENLPEVGAIVIQTDKGPLIMERSLENENLWYVYKRPKLATPYDESREVCFYVAPPMYDLLVNQKVIHFKLGERYRIGNP